MLVSPLISILLLLICFPCEDQFFAFLAKNAIPCTPALSIHPAPPPKVSRSRKGGSSEHSESETPDVVF